MNILYHSRGLASRQVASEKVPSLHHVEDQKDTGREGLYHQHFITQVERVSSPAVFIEQVNGYGVQVFAQMSSFTQK